MIATHFRQTNKRILKALLSLASAALLVRVMGMLNQVVVSSRFGAGAAMDAYFVAYTTPNLIAFLLIGAIESSVIPAYTRVRSGGDMEQASRLFSTLLNLLLVGTGVLTLLMLVFRQQITFFSAPGLDLLRLDLAVRIAPLLYPIVILMTVIELLECIFNVEGQFGWPAYAGLLVPLTTSVLVLLMHRSLGITALCIGMVVGLCLQLGIFTIRARRCRLVYRPVIDLRLPEIAIILAVGWPALLGTLINQIGPLVDQIFASSLSMGSISALGYSLKIVSVFSGAIFTSIGRAALPYFSQQISANDFNALKATLRFYLWTVGIGMVVVSALMIVLAHPIVQLLFQRGAFSSSDTNLTATTLTGFIVGLTPMALGFITVRAFSALGKTKVFVWVSIFSVLANAIFDFIFAHFWQSQGIALATSGVYFCTMILNFVMLRHYIGPLDLFKPPVEFSQFFVWRKTGRPVALSSSTQKTVVSRKAARGNEKNQGESLMNAAFQKQRAWSAIARPATILTIFIVGTAGIFINASYTLRIAIGSIFMLAFLRYRFALLAVWLLSFAAVGMIPALTNNNFQTILTIPTLLLLMHVPVLQAMKRMPALFLLFGYLLWVFAGIGLSPLGTTQFLIAWITYLNYLAVAVLTICLLTTEQRLAQLVDVILLGAACIALFGIYGYFTHQNGIVDLTSATQIRIISVFGSAPTLALFLSMVLPLGIYSAFTAQSLFKRCYSLVVVVILLSALGLTFTRSAFISLPVSLIVMLLFLPSGKMKLSLFGGMLALALLIVLVATAFNFPLFDRFFNEDIATLNGRTMIWSALLVNFEPLLPFGQGLGAAGQVVASLYVANGLGGIATSSHNLFLGTLYDHGIIGLLWLAGALLLLTINLLTGMRKATGKQRALYATVLAILVSVLIQCFETDDILTPGVAIYFWIMMALPFAFCWHGCRQEQHKRI